MAVKVDDYHCWGRIDFGPQKGLRLGRRASPLPPVEPGTTILPYGNGRSYGDCCLNTDGILLDCRPLDRFIAFDEERGILRCEAGVLFAEILDLIVPRGWFLPVTPGTRFVTVGGAIANDVHGKNHHRAGTFGRHVRCFELMRSDGRRLLCSTRENRELFEATIGGLGLTGLVVWAELQLRPIATPYIDREVVRFDDLAAFFRLSRESDAHFEYTVAWIDCLARGRSLGRGVFARGNHAQAPPSHTPKGRGRALAVPVVPPVSLVNRLSLRLFNTLYYRRQPAERGMRRIHYRAFFYPLDAIADWNRLYGPNGFYQFQCVLPPAHGESGVAEMLQTVAASGTGSFLAVLKLFGDRPSPGMLSFPRPGVTLALDFPNSGTRVHALLDRLGEITQRLGGAVYPAKDARMSPGAFRCGYPGLAAFAKHIDPAFSSSFWRRVAGRPPRDTRS